MAIAIGDGLDFVNDIKFRTIGFLPFALSFFWNS